MNKSKQTGLTLVELMIVIAILVFLVGVGVPNLQSFIKNNRLLAQTNQFMVAVKTARSEAMTQRLPVILCTSANGTACGGGWTDGHLAYVDANENGSLDNGEQILLANVATSTGISVAYTGGTTVRFDRRGRAVGSSGTVRFCDDRGTNYARGITIDPIGRSAPYSGTVACPEGS